MDIATPPTVFEAVKADLEEFFAANASEYSGKFLCVANFAGDPLKVGLRRSLIPQTLPVLTCAIFLWFGACDVCCKLSPAAPLNSRIAVLHQILTSTLR